MKQNLKKKLLFSYIYYIYLYEYNEKKLCAIAQKVLKNAGKILKNPPYSQRTHDLRISLSTCLLDLTNPPE